MHPVLLLAFQGASVLSNPAPMDSVIWLPVYYDGYYARPNGGPTWSPDDEHLAFSYFDYVPPQYFYTRLHVFLRDGTTRECSIDPFSNGRAAWSPLGNEIAVNDGPKIVVLVPEDCSFIREITAAGWSPSWSRDGQRIAFEAWGTLKTVSAAGGDERFVVDEAWQPDWSPDGRSIVFVRGGNLWTVSVDGTNQRQITQSGQDEWPAWSRDGSRIAFTRSDPDWQHMGVWIVGANGGPATQVTPFVEAEQRARPCWSRDGTWLTYFVMSWTEYRIGVGITRNVNPTAVQIHTWRAVKESYR